MIPDTSPEARKAFIEGLYAAYAAGDPGPSLAVLSDDVLVEYVAPSRMFAFAGPRRGKQAALDAALTIARDWEVLSLTVVSVLVDGDEVCVKLDARFRSRADGAEIACRLVDVARIKDGLIVELKEYFDAEDVAMQLYGRRLAVSGA